MKLLLPSCLYMDKRNPIKNLSVCVCRSHDSIKLVHRSSAIYTAPTHHHKKRFELELICRTWKTRIREWNDSVFFPSFFHVRSPFGFFFGDVCHPRARAITSELIKRQKNNALSHRGEKKWIIYRSNIWTVFFFCYRIITVREEDKKKTKDERVRETIPFMASGGGGGATNQRHENSRYCSKRRKKKLELGETFFLCVVCPRMARKDRKWCVPLHQS